MAHRKSEHRSTIPEPYRIELGRRIKNEVRRYTERKTQEVRTHYRPSTLMAAHLELQTEYGIPVRTMEMYETGERTPNILDLRNIARFLGTTMEHLMQDVPALKEQRL